MNAPDDLLYTDQHEWIRVEGDIGTIGVTDYAQNALSDVTFVDLPEIGGHFAQGQEVGAIESCKAAAGFFTPVSGRIVEVNGALEEDPGLVNREPYGRGWICKLSVDDPPELEKLLKPGQYAALAGKEQ